MGLPVARLTISLGAELAAVPVELPVQPLVQRAELTPGDFLGNFRVRLQGRRIELRAQDVADGVPLKGAADAAAIPMDVLQAAVAVVGRLDAEIRLEAGAPGIEEGLSP